MSIIRKRKKELRLLFVDDIEQRNVWTKCELFKQHNQYKYNKWYRAEDLINKGADEDSWKVAAKIANIDELDPIIELFK
ncbi:964_t:CDS:2, partial [Racocetra persica]